MRFKITGANSESGDDVNVLLDAPTQGDVEKLAHDRGILVETVTLVDAAPSNGGHANGGSATGGNGHGGNGHGHAKDMEAISLVDDEPAADGTAQVHGMITTSANCPSDTAHTGSGHIEEGKKAESAMEYHVMINQSLFLLESAVNRQLHDGWEPMGGVAVAVTNNAPQYFQALIRRKKA